MIEMIKNYAELINIGLFATIMGLLFRYSTISRLAIKDKSDAEIAGLKATKELLEAREESASKNHAEEVRLLEKELAMYKALSEMPEEKRIIASKIDNENIMQENPHPDHQESIIDIPEIEDKAQPISDIDATFKNYFLNRLNDK
jgi:hypothetical protein